MKFDKCSDNVSTYIGPLTACVLIRLFQLTHTLNMNNIVAEEFHKKRNLLEKQNKRRTTQSQNSVM